MLRILDITAPDINNGTGIRITLWVAGCTHHCKGCHNQWTWNYNQGKIFKDNKEEIYSKLSDWLKRDYVAGLTFSGGDPIRQDTDALKSEIEIINWVRENYPEKNIWIYCGDEYECLPNNSLEKTVLELCDVIIEGEYVKELRDIVHCPFRGSKNQRILYKQDNRFIEKRNT